VVIVNWSRVDPLRANTESRGYSQLEPGRPAASNTESRGYGPREPGRPAASTSPQAASFEEQTVRGIVRVFRDVPSADTAADDNDGNSADCHGGIAGTAADAP